MELFEINYAAQALLQLRILDGERIEFYSISVAQQTTATYIVTPLAAIS
jgi:hypothetical protein